MTARTATWRSTPRGASRVTPSSLSLGRTKPTRVELTAARTKRVPDVIAKGLHVLFVGINPGLYSAAVGHHFARPGNRFWPVLSLSGFTRGLVSRGYSDQQIAGILGENFLRVFEVVCG